MHELSLALEIVEVVLGAAEGRRVRRIALEVGRDAAVSSEALQLHFDLACEGTSAAGARLEVVAAEGAGLWVRELEVDD